ncbi:MAG: MBL fold metallo-hydrolase [Terracoccus sp.]
MQVHAYDEHTILLRQSKALTYEAPFLYLLFGNERALLLDTGAVADPERMPLRTTIDGVVKDWLRRHPRTDYELVVAHTHDHGDHVSGDGQFVDRPSTTVVGRDVAAVKAFFGFGDWPREIVHLDLGGRVLEVTGIPGHHDTSVAIFDPWSGLLLTGDTVYPGRLYVEDPRAFRDSLDALVSMTQTRPVSAVMGCHIEMTATPGRDYPLGTTYQPHEPPLAMSVAQLREVREAAVLAHDRPGVHHFDDFAIYNGPCTLAMARQLLRRTAQTLRTRLSTARTTRGPRRVRRRRADAWDFGSLAVLSSWWSLDRWIGTAQNGTDLASLALTIALTAGAVFNCWRAIRGFVGSGARERGLSVSTPPTPTPTRHQ